MMTSTMKSDPTARRLAAIPRITGISAPPD
jgi:hypothetical protein